MTHRIALIHAVRVAIAPVEEAFARHWPAAARMNLLDDSRSRAGAGSACSPRSPRACRRWKKSSA
jgi:hypothetical protein